MTRLLRIFLLFLCGTLWADTPFPAAYTERIDMLSKRHPNWRFLPYPIDDLDWEAILKEKGLPVVFKETNGAMCSLDGKNC